MAIYIIYITTMTSMRAILSKTICSTEDVGFEGNGFSESSFSEVYTSSVLLLACMCPVSWMSLSYCSHASRFPVLLPTGKRRDRETTRATAHCTLCCGDILTFLLLLGQWLQALFHLKICHELTSCVIKGIVLLTV